MKTFEIELTQQLKGYYTGTIEIEANNKREAWKKIKAMSKEELDEEADWTHGDEYSGDVHSIVIEENSIMEI